MAAEANRPPFPDPQQLTRVAGFPPAGRGVAGRRGLRGAGLSIALAALGVPMLTACGSGPAHPGAAGATISATCSAVGAALSDGPDPGVDPAGYAEAQIGPLAAIQTSDHALRVAIRDLADAYARVLASNGTSAAASRAVTAAARQVNGICPGAAS